MPNTHICTLSVYVNIVYNVNNIAYYIYIYVVFHSHLIIRHL